MNLLKKSRIAFVFMTLATLSQAQPKIKVCLTGRIIENLNSYRQSFINAAQLSKSENDPFDKVEIKNYFYNNRPLEPMYIYDKMIADGCSAIIGFEYLSDLLLATKKQTNTYVPIFSSYASTKKSEKLPENIFIFMPSYDYQANKMMEYLKKHYNNMDRVLLVTEINRDEMLKYKDVYSSALEKEHIKYDTFDFLENDSDIEGKIKKFLNNNKYQCVFLLSGSIASAKVANLMNDHKTIFVGTENFGSSVSQTFFIQLNDKAIKSHFIRNLDFIQTTPALAKFQAEYTRQYTGKPTILSAYTYDSMNIILKALAEHGSVNTNSVLNIDYSGVTGAHLKNHKFYRSSDYIILSVSKDGYTHEE
jgi:ABC-type branched-subunit amino acid transport system substrate-binding protein